MTKNGYIKASLVSPRISIGNPLKNVDTILNILNHSQSAITLFPELSITGYTSGDLFFQEEYLNQALEALNKIIDGTTYKGVFILGMPLKVQDVLFNCAVVIEGKTIKGVIPKYFLPNSKEFYEKRWFQSGFQAHFNKVKLLNQEVPFGKMIFKDEKNDITFGVEICQDMWAIQTPGDELSLAGAHMIFNLSASTESVFKPETRKYAVLDQSRKHVGAYLYTSSGSTESTADLIFSSHKLVASLGELIDESTLIHDQDILTADINIEAIRYQRRIDSTFRDEQIYQHQSIPKISVHFDVPDTYRFEKPLNPYPFLPESHDMHSLKLANEIQVRGLIKKLEHMPKSKIVIGVSGGLDSALALLVAHQAMKRLNRDLKDIIAVTLPSKVTKNDTLSDALNLMHKLDVTALEIPIYEQVKLHLQSINHQGDLDITYENAQARIRTLILMDLANQHHGFVLGTGDMSEIALGWMTFNGDQMSMYGVNSGVTKTWVQTLIKYHLNHDYKALKDTLERIVERPISPELKDDQKTEDVVGRYDINDFILYHHLVSGANEAKCGWLVQEAFNLTEAAALVYANRFFDRFYNQQFKRQPMPEGPKVLKVSLSPRGELRLPSEIKRK